jgi:hypothetical protein
VDSSTKRQRVSAIGLGENNTTPPGQVLRYLAARGLRGPWRLEGIPADGSCSGAIVIPSLAEGRNLFATLDSIAKNPQSLLQTFPVIVVVNNRSDSPVEDKEDNQRTLRMLSDYARTGNGILLGWVDAASAGSELPPKEGGVGLARKIGLDLALDLVDYSGAEPLLVCLDADTVVGPDYLQALTDHFRTAEVGGGVIPFRHLMPSDPRERDAIIRYELFLRCYVLGLARAGSPYAFHTVGSAMACTAASYVKAGGMNTRVAAEDFYFLQQLHKTSGIAQVAGTTVFPSGRCSGRVPFGTGRSVSRLLAGDPEAVLFYRPECFRVLESWLGLVRDNLGECGAHILAAADAVSDDLREYLESAGFSAAWENLRRHNHNDGRLHSAFHGWFDGLKTMRLIHHLSAERYPRCAPAEAVPDLLRWTGIVPPEGQEAQLNVLREMQGSGSIST